MRVHSFGIALVTGSIAMADATGPGVLTPGPVLAFDPQLTNQLITIESGDIDGDNDIDLVVFGTDPDGPFESADLILCMNDGRGQFAPTPIDIDGWMPYVVDFVLQDLDADGDLDLAWTGARIADGVFALVSQNNSGDGSFSTPQPVWLDPEINVDIDPYDFPFNTTAVGDVDGDGNLDLATTRAFNFVGTDAVVLLGDGAGNFAEQPMLQFGLWPFGVELCDLNNDGFDDIAGIAAGADRLVIQLSNGDGTFQLIDPGLPANTLDRPRDISAVDLDSDGFLDLVLSVGQSIAMMVFYGDGTGMFTQPVVLATDFGPAGADIADVNGDGFLDIIATDQGHQAHIDGGPLVTVLGYTLSLFLGEGNRTFSDRISFEMGGSSDHPSAPSTVAAADFDGNGVADVAAVMQATWEARILLSTCEIGCNDADLVDPFGQLDLADISAFTGAFLSGDLLADLDSNGLLDLTDVGNFVNDFVSGCP